jgi:hypothetical protein
MLVIRNAQMEQLTAPAVERFVDEVTLVIAEDHPPKVAELGVPGIRAIVLRAIEKGEALDVRNEGAVAALAELMVLFGEDFRMSPERPYAEKVLAHPTLPDYARVDLARRRMCALTKGRTIVRWDAPESEADPDEEPESESDEPSA